MSPFRDEHLKWFFVLAALAALFVVILTIMD